MLSVVIVRSTPRQLAVFFFLAIYREMQRFLQQEMDPPCLYLKKCNCIILEN